MTCIKFIFPWLFIIFFRGLPPAANSEGADIHDIKGPLAYGWNPFPFLIAGFFLILLIGFLVFYFKKMKKGERILPPRPAHEIAYQALEELKKKELPDKGRLDDYYLELSETIRKYLEDRFGHRTPEMTSEELLLEISLSKDLSPEQKSLLNGFFMHCDQVKFAKYRPSSKEIDWSFKAGREIIDQTKEGVSV
jgi:hypothetical protein